MNVWLIDLISACGINGFLSRMSKELLVKYFVGGWRKRETLSKKKLLIIILREERWLSG